MALGTIDPNEQFDIDEGLGADRPVLLHGNPVRLLGRVGRLRVGVQGGSGQGLLIPGSNTARCSCFPVAPRPAAPTRGWGARSMVDRFRNAPGVPFETSVPPDLGGAG